MPPNIRRAVWDSCVVIDVLQKTPGRYGKIEPFLKDAEGGDFQIVLSEATVVEVSYLKALDDKGVSRDKQQRLIAKWLNNPYIARRTVHPGISELAAKLGNEYAIKRVGDRMVIATAVFEGIAVVHTFDGAGKNSGLLSLDRTIPLGNSGEKLRICEPDYYANTMYEGVNGQ